MYKIPHYSRTSLRGIENEIGETIEKKVRRITENKEPIKDGAPEIFTERKDGVIPSTNIRTDRWEIATDAMDAISRNRQAQRDARIKDAEPKVVNMDGKEVGGAESTQGEKGAK